MCLPKLRSRKLTNFFGPRESTKYTQFKCLFPLIISRISPLIFTSRYPGFCARRTSHKVFRPGDVCHRFWFFWMIRFLFYSVLLFSNADYLKKQEEVDEFSTWRFQIIPNINVPKASNYCRLKFFFFIFNCLEL